MSLRKIFQVVTLTGAVYGFAGWLYIVLNSEFHPYTLHWQLTHFTSWPHEDTFGEMCMLVSIICFVIYNFIKDPRSSKK